MTEPTIWRRYMKCTIGPSDSDSVLPPAGATGGLAVPNVLASLDNVGHNIHHRCMEMWRGTLIHTVSKLGPSSKSGFRVVTIIQDPPRVQKLVTDPYIVFCFIVFLFWHASQNRSNFSLVVANYYIHLFLHIYSNIVMTLSQFGLYLLTFASVLIIAHLHTHIHRHWHTHTSTHVWLLHKRRTEWRLGEPTTEAWLLSPKSKGG